MSVEEGSKHIFRQRLESMNQCQMLESRRAGGSAQSQELISHIFLTWSHIFSLPLVDDYVMT